MDKKDKVKRTIRIGKIMIRIVLFLAGVALLGFFLWLGVSIYNLLLGV